jgi:hypothetical protein
VRPDKINIKVSLPIPFCARPAAGHLHLPQDTSTCRRTAPPASRQRRHQRGRQTTRQRTAVASTMRSFPTPSRQTHVHNKKSVIVAPHQRAPSAVSKIIACALTPVLRHEVTPPARLGDTTSSSPHDNAGASSASPFWFHISPHSPIITRSLFCINTA